ncbi:MAG TPA: tRNA lysidine(34) synthetase TilS [Fimbriimonadales bacterium]|nr:tRNA lysidine(34) synthetase TilS [Fimbriimonadales bacterium]
MYQRLLNFIQRHNLLREGERVIVGYSGGADSTCLLHLLHRAGYEVIAAHLNHMQRPEAEKEERFCEEQAKKLGVRFVSERADVPKIAKEKKIGIEEAGRFARYDFFCRLHKSFDAKVATAHTLDDHIETIFLHLARGSGLTGVSGISVQRDFIVRPLLWARRKETHAFCEKENLPILSDPANVDENFTRVRVRKVLIPAWESLHPSAVENLARFASIAREEDIFLDAQARNLLSECEIEPHPELSFLHRDVERTFDVGCLQSHPKVLLRRAIRSLVHQFKREISYELTEQILEAILQKHKNSVTLEGGDVVLETSQRQFRIRSLENPPDFCIPLSIPGEVAFDGWKIVAQKPQLENAGLKAIISMANVRGSLVVRPFRPGDRIQPAKSRYERKLQDVLTDAKVSSALKRRLPLVCDDEGPLWVPGVCIASRAAPDASSESVSLQLLPMTPE